MIDDATLLTQFLENTVDLETFDHAAHVRVTYLLLRDRPLPETMIALRDGLKRIAARAGKPEKYHETVTFAFAAVINSRIRAGDSWDAFARENADLFAWRGVLDRIYDRETLGSDAARRSFVLPLSSSRSTSTSTSTIQIA